MASRHTMEKRPGLEIEWPTFYAVQPVHLPIRTVSSGWPILTDSILTATSIELVPVWMTCPLSRRSCAGFRGDNMSRLRRMRRCGYHEGRKIGHTDQLRLLRCRILFPGCVPKSQPRGRAYVCTQSSLLMNQDVPSTYEDKKLLLISSVSRFRKRD